jgi:hypothetical protein
MGAFNGATLLELLVYVSAIYLIARYRKSL